MSAHPGRLVGELESAAAREPAATGASPAHAVRPGLARFAARAVGAESWLAPLGALGLLTAPSPLAWVGALVGLLPLLGRTVLTGRPWRRTAFDLPLVLLVLGSLAGAAASLSREGALVRLAGLLAGLLLFAAAREQVGTEPRQRRVVLGGLALAVVACAVLLVLVGPFLRLDHVPGLAGLVAALDRWQLGAWVVDQDWLLQRYRLRASGVGALADVGLALAFAALVGLWGRRAALLPALTIPFFLVVLISTDNRGSIVAGALTLGMMATVLRRRLLVLVPLGGLAVLLLLAFGPVERGLSVKTLAQRFWFWENSLYLARELPLTGAGLGLESVQLVYRGYFLPAYPPFSHAHNIYLQGLLEMGVLGLLGLLGLAAAILWLGWKLPPAASRWQTAARLAGYGAALALLVAGLTEIVLLSTVGGALALGAFGLLAGTAEPESQRAVARPADPRSASDAPPGDSSGGRLSGAASQPRASASRAWRRGHRLALAALVALLVLGAGLAASGLGARLGARLLLGLGAAELNRAAFSETIGKDERAQALDRAVWLLRTAGGLDPTDPTIQRSLALALAENDDPRRGRAAADRAKALTDPADRANLFQLGRAYVAISAWGEAIRAWQAAEAGPQLLQLGNRLIRARNFDQAVNAFIATARVQPDSRGAYEGIAEIARERELTADETLEELEPLLEPGSPTEYGARLQAGRVLRAAGRLRDAVAMLLGAEAIHGGADLQIEIGRVLLAAGLADAAEPLLVDAARSLPYEPESWLLLAQTRRRLGQPAEAGATVRAGLAKLDPSGRFAPPAERLPETAAVRAVEIKRSERALLLGVLGESLALLGRPAEALDALDEAVAARPDDPALAATRAEIAAVLAGAAPNLLLNGDFADAEAWTLRPADWRRRPTLRTVPNQAPELRDGAARLEPRGEDGRLLLQEVAGLAPGARYRLTARLRGENLGGGHVFLALLAPGADRPLAVTTTTAGDWVTVDVEATLPTDAGTTAYVAVGLSAGAPRGAAAWADAVSLTADGPTAAPVGVQPAPR